MLSDVSKGSTHPVEVFTMSCPRVRLTFAMVVSIVAGLACGDYGQPTSPDPISQKLLPPTLVVRSPFSLAPRGLRAEAVRWGPAHRNVDQSASALIGPDGGSLSIPGADFSMTIPAGALTSPTTITVVARAGIYVVYDMYPHGLKFRQPVSAVQGLSTTAGYGTSKISAVRTAYLSAGNERISAKGFASAAELSAATTYFYGAERIAETHEWILNHFSRYILVSGVWTEVEDVEEGGGDVETNGFTREPVELDGRATADSTASGRNAEPDSTESEGDGIPPAEEL
jgi:hypothetical protein